MPNCVNSSSTVVPAILPKFVARHHGLRVKFTGADYRYSPKTRHSSRPIGSDFPKVSLALETREANIQVTRDGSSI